MTRLYGHRPDPPGLPRHVGGHLAGVLYGAASPRPNVDNRQSVLDGPGIGDQKSNSCVLYSKTHGIEALFNLRGTPIAHLSPADAYCSSRLLERRAAFPDAPPDMLPALTDIGSIPSFGNQAIATCGVAPLDVRADDPVTINDPPTLGEEERASEFKLEGWSRIDAENDDERILQLHIAIDAGFFPDGAMKVDDAFEAYTGGIYRPGGAFRGNHDILFCGVETLSTGWRLFWLANHWTPGWGDGGFVLMHETQVKRMTDISVLNPRRIA